MHSERYLLELLDTTTQTVARISRRLDHDAQEDRETLRLILHELGKISKELTPPPPTPTLATRITFKETL